MILGPPGCGKTTTAIERFGTEILQGVPAERIAFLTFTRSAREEAATRLQRNFGLTPDDTPWVRTVHSCAFHLLGLRRGAMITRDHWSEFGRPFGYRFTSVAESASQHELPLDLPQRTPGDQLRLLYLCGRNRCLSLDASLLKTSMTDIRPRDFISFAERLEKYKRRSGVMDFCDLLERAIEANFRPPVVIAFIDEAQDLSPLQSMAVETWFGTCKRVYVVGDDDQAIYGFNGADPTWLLGLAERTRPEILTQSHRLPASPHALAHQIICRNQARIPKDYLPQAAAGAVLRLSPSKALQLVDGRRKTFILGRNRTFLRSYAAALIERRVPFHFDGGGPLCPMANVNAVFAVNTAVRIHRSASMEDPIEAAALRAMLAFIPGSSLPRGTKARIKALDGPIRPSSIFQFDRVKRLLRETNVVDSLSRIPRSHRDYFNALMAGREALPEPQVFLTTIHGAKGREADLVLVIPDMTRTTYRAYTMGSKADVEGENRVFYVAVTRTRETVVLIEPQTRRYYRFPRNRS